MGEGDDGLSRCFFEFAEPDSPVRLGALWGWAEQASRGAPGSPARACELRLARAIASAFGLDPSVPVVRGLALPEGEWSSRALTFGMTGPGGLAFGQMWSARVAMSAPAATLEGWLEGHPFAAFADEAGALAPEVRRVGREALSRMRSCAALLDDIDRLLFALQGVTRDPAEERTLAAVLEQDPELARWVHILEY